MDLRRGQLAPFERGAERHPPAVPLRSNALDLLLTREERDAAEDDAELLRGAAKSFDSAAFREGHLTPILFGSALRRFAVDQLLEFLADFSPPPQPQAVTRDGRGATIEPGEDQVAGFVFKIQANMDPNHRDRVAFVRLSSGRFVRGMKLTVQNTGRQITVNAPVMFFAADRELAHEAFAGDVIGIPNHGVLRVGDSLSQAGNIRFAGLPNFAPEVLRRVRVTDPLRAKHLQKALVGLAEEGVTQLFRPLFGVDFIVGAVGPLQLDVMTDRLNGEYSLDVVFEASPFSEARWVTGSKETIDNLIISRRSAMARDVDGQLVFLAKSAWEIGYVAEQFADLRFATTRDRA